MTNAFAMKCYPVVLIALLCLAGAPVSSAFNLRAQNPFNPAVQTTPCPNAALPNVFPLIIPKTTTAVPTPGVNAGLMEEIFYFPQGSSLQSLAVQTPNAVRNVAMVNYLPKKGAWKGLARLDQFAARWSGFLVITNAGPYKFILASDDGSTLFIDNMLLVNNDGLHAMQKAQATRVLTSSSHPLRLEFFQKEGAFGMVFAYGGPDTFQQLTVVPPQVLRKTPFVPKAVSAVAAPARTPAPAPVTPKPPVTIKQSDLAKAVKKSKAVADAAAAEAAKYTNTAHSTADRARKTLAAYHTYVAAKAAWAAAAEAVDAKTLPDAVNAAQRAKIAACNATDSAKIADTALTTQAAKSAQMAAAKAAQAAKVDGKIEFAKRPNVTMTEKLAKEAAAAADVAEAAMKNSSKIPKTAPKGVEQAVEQAEAARKPANIAEAASMRAATASRKAADIAKYTNHPVSTRNAKFADASAKRACEAAQTASGMRSLKDGQAVQIMARIKEIQDMTHKAIRAKDAAARAALKAARATTAAGAYKAAMEAKAAAEKAAAAAANAKTPMAREAARIAARMARGAMEDYRKLKAKEDAEKARALAAARTAKAQAEAVRRAVEAAKAAYKAAELAVNAKTLAEALRAMKAAEAASKICEEAEKFAETSTSKKAMKLAADAVAKCKEAIDILKKLIAVMEAKIANAKKQALIAADALRKAKPLARKAQTLEAMRNLPTKKKASDVAKVSAAVNQLSDEANAAAKAAAKFAELTGPRGEVHAKAAAGSAKKCTKLAATATKAETRTANGVYAESHAKNAASKANEAEAIASTVKTSVQPLTMAEATRIMTATLDAEKKVNRLLESVLGSAAKSKAAAKISMSVRAQNVAMGTQGSVKKAERAAAKIRKAKPIILKICKAVIVYEMAFIKAKKKCPVPVDETKKAPKSKSKLPLGLKEEVFYFTQTRGLQNLDKHQAMLVRTVRTVNVKASTTKWPGLVRGEHYAVRWTGSILIKTHGVYTFSLTSDDGSKLFIANGVMVNNDGVHGMKTKTGKRTLAKKWQPMRIEYFQRRGKAGIAFKYSGRDTKGKTVIVPNAVLQKDQHLPKIFNGGLKEEIFYFKQSPKVPDFKNKKPNRVRLSKMVNYPASVCAWPGLLKDSQFAVRWTGSIAVRRGGKYKFSIQSDDGSKLYLGNSLIANNDGIHSMKVKFGQRLFKAGPHKVRLEYFQLSGWAGMIFKYAGTDTANIEVVVPQSAFSKTPSVPGLKEQAFFFQQRSLLSDLNGKTPSMVRVVKTVNYIPTKKLWPGFPSNANFGVRWTGYLSIKRTGKYIFQLESDDGSKLYVDKALLVSNDGLHGLRKRHGKKTMRASLHKLRLEYFQKSGVMAMVMKYKGPDSHNGMVVVPRRFLMAPAKNKAKECPLIKGRERIADWSKTLNKVGWSYTGGPVTGLYRSGRDCQDLRCMQKAHFKVFSGISQNVPSKNSDLMCYNAEWSQNFGKGKTGWSKCNRGFFLTGFHRDTGPEEGGAEAVGAVQALPKEEGGAKDEISADEGMLEKEEGPKKSGMNGVDSIDKVRCCKPTSTSSYSRCLVEDWSTTFGVRGWSKCSQKDMAIVGMYHEKTIGLSSLKKVKCCALSSATCSR